jgi:hypothetical protein
MKITLNGVLLILAFACFALAALDVKLAIHLTAAGLALWVLALLVV